MNKLSNEIISQAYDSLVTSRDWKYRLGYVNLKELYQKIRKDHIKSLTITQFKLFMFNFWKHNCPDNYNFSRGSSIHNEVRTYGFCVNGYLGGLYYYIRKTNA